MELIKKNYNKNCIFTDFPILSLLGLAIPSKGRTIRKLMGGAGEVQRKYSREGKLNEKKIHARQLTLKNIHAIA